MCKNVIKKFVIRNKYILLISLFYFFLRVVNLTKLPIFNDESIYLDWGWKEVHIPGMLFYSLYDAKQPFIMWVFGIFQNFFNDPLFAGRFVSIITGYLSFLAIFFISKHLFSYKTATIASFFYVIIPIFSFYDRQALMESSIAATGLWSLYYLLKINKNTKKKYFIIIGVILGIGFFIKTSALLFVSAFAVINLIFCLKYGNWKIIRYLPLTFLTMLIVDFLLFIQPMFWETFLSNNRYSLEIKEQLSFPINIWISNLFGNIEIAFVYITPLVFISGLIGIIFLFLRRNKKYLIFIFWFSFIFALQTIVVGKTSTRYLVPFLPYFVISASFFTVLLIEKWKTKGLCILLVIIFPAVLLNSFQIFNPLKYFNILSKITRYSDNGYIYSWTSGYGVVEARNLIKSELGENVGFVGVRLDAGNPESAIFAYFQKDKKIKPIYFDSKIINSKIMEYDCFESEIPIYFVSRGSQLAGLENYLKEIRRFYKPMDKEYIGVYILKDKCLGSAFKLKI